jgi:hypothetical protein
MLLIYDGLEGKYFTETFWHVLDPDEEIDEEPEIHGPMSPQENNNTSLVHQYISELRNAIPGKCFSTSEFNFLSKINVLIEHHHKQFTMGLLMWPKSFKKWKKKRILYKARVEDYLYNSLYVKNQIILVLIADISDTVYSLML